MANEGNRRQAVGADFTRRTTTRPRASSFNGGSLADLDELRDELDDLNTMEHPIFDALERDTVAHTQQRIRTPWKRTLFRLFESPTSSTEAFVIYVVSTTLIILSAFITILETLPVFHSTSSHVWFGLETMLVVLFTIEYVCRFVAHSESWAELWNWAGSFFAIADLLAVFPYYIMIAIRADTTTFFRFSILRTFRLLRAFRPFRYSNMILLTIEVMYLAVKRSKDALFALAFFVGMILVVFSTLLYFAERGTWDSALATFVNSDGDPSQFESIPAAAWFVLVTITTVGYGEIIPRSFLGRLITLPLLMFGLLLIALPSFVLGREFSSVWEAMGGTKRLRLASQQNRISRQPPADPEARPSLNGQEQEPPQTADSDIDNPERRGLIFTDGSSSPVNHNYPPRQPAPRTPLTSENNLFSPIRRRRRDSLGGDDGSGISNLKLAENQQVLSSQLDELMATVKALRDEVQLLRDR